MLRSIAIIEAAIRFSAPNLSDTTVERYAPVIQQEAKKRDFDPITLIAMVHHESHWNARLVNGIGCVGLGQICLSNYPYCRADRQSAKCQSKKAQLQNGVYNLKQVASHITRNRKYCKRVTGKPTRWYYWLPSYQGYNKPSQGITCGQKKVKGRWVRLPVARLTRRVMSKRAQIIRHVSKRRRKKRRGKH